jgi:hypothetical protein
VIIHVSIDYKDDGSSDLETVWRRKEIKIDIHWNTRMNRCLKQRPWLALLHRGYKRLGLAEKAQP